VGTPVPVGEGLVDWDAGVLAGAVEVGVGVGVGVGLGLAVVDDEMTLVGLDVAGEVGF
jgi:hypothetical protein